jgi:hypothetical protein
MPLTHQSPLVLSGGISPTGCTGTVENWVTTVFAAYVTANAQASPSPA